MSNDMLMVRIYLSEADHGKRRALMQEILTLLHDRHAVQGVTVFRGIAGFGASGEVHADDLLRLNVDLPLVIGLLDDLVPKAHIISWLATRSGAPTPRLRRS
jgi:PII-like signaling protein